MPSTVATVRDTTEILTFDRTDGATGGVDAYALGDLATVILGDCVVQPPGM